MAKGKPEPVSGPPPSVLVPERSTKALKELLLKHGPPTFEGAARRYSVGAGDNAVILKAAMEAIERGDVAYSKEAVTLAHRAYWELYDERQE